MPFKSIEERRQFQREYYERNKELYRLRQIERRARNKSIINEAKKLGCSRCKENHPACIDFHHIDESTKSFTIGDFMKVNCGIERLLAEISKCVLLCSNCHRKLHWCNE